MNKKQERVNQILALFAKKECLSLKELAEQLDISEMTARRDIASLQEANLVVRGAKVGTFSLANKVMNMREDYVLSNEEAKNAEEKTRIGRFAATLISSGDTVIIDTGTTTVKLVRNIPDDYEFTALCYDFSVFRELVAKPRSEIILAGGLLNRRTQSFSSEESLNTISKFRASKFFISASGVHEKLGLTCGYHSEISIKRAAMQSSLTKILLADSSKFGCIRTAYFGELKEIDVIVTDTGLSPEWERQIRNMGIELYLV